MNGDDATDRELDAAHVEAQNAAALALHSISSVSGGERTCQECQEPEPCPTARALGAEPAPAPADPGGTP